MPTQALGGLIGAQGGITHHRLTEALSGARIAFSRRRTVVYAAVLRVTWIRGHVPTREGGQSQTRRAHRYRKHEDLHPAK